MPIRLTLSAILRTVPARVGENSHSHTSYHLKHAGNGEDVTRGVKICRLVRRIPLSCGGNACQDAKANEHYYADAYPLCRHVQQERAQAQTDDEHDETDDVQTERHTHPPLRPKRTIRFGN